MQIRRMSVADIADVEKLTATAFHELDVATRPADWPAPERRSADRVEPWRARIRHLVETDGQGCWVADFDGRILGAAAALRRGNLWGLSTYAVEPGHQGGGVGRALLEAALGYGEADSPGIICSSHDPRAARRYRLAGFDLHPTMLMWGVVQRSALPALTGLRDGTADDIELLDELDRGTRGAGHGVDHCVLLEQLPLRIYEHGRSRAYAYLHPSGGAHLLAGTDVRSAAAVLWATLAMADPNTPIGFHNLTAAQQWAVDVGLQAGLELHNRGYLALRAMAPPTPYIPSGHFL